MKIVVLDAYTLNPGERRWEELEELGEVVVHDRTAQLDVVRRAKDLSSTYKCNFLGADNKQ